MPQTRLDRYLADYNESHQHPTNQLIHKVCVPVILFTVLGLLQNIPVLPFMGKEFYWSYFLIAFTLFFYAQFKNVKVFVGFMGMIIPMLLIQDQIDHNLWINLFLFIVAWIFQFLGHKIEGKKPSFFKDIFFLLIGPIWVLKWLFSKFKIELQAA